MNLRKRTKRKRASWSDMARTNCRMFGLPFKRLLTWEELPEFYKEHNDLKDVPYIVIHWCPGCVLVLPALRESDFTPVKGV